MGWSRLGIPQAKQQRHRCVTGGTVKRNWHETQAIWCTLGKLNRPQRQPCKAGLKEAGWQGWRANKLAMMALRVAAGRIYLEMHLAGPCRTSAGTNRHGDSVNTAAPAQARPWGVETAGMRCASSGIAQSHQLRKTGAFTLYSLETVERIVAGTP